jgi:hypothetical protein
VWSSLVCIQDTWDTLTKQGSIRNGAGLKPKYEAKVSSHGALKFAKGDVIVKVIRQSPGVYDM